MIQEFIHSITGVQLTVVIFLVVYFLSYGVRYHVIALYAFVTGRGLANNFLGRLLNTLGYTAIIACIYWWV
tara:strand:+ start:678 stop:890 length:213 start_codon:yes stop_codon:yes gene_type:complete